ncbi:bacitracin export permease protein BceB [Paenibacillus albidus]|uniref:Bacitracin export permease protein BceB n=1 Tax=Paenibacillus albidus TaxID=2041023 RepID=A0A917FMJ9_9BACL|nr:FtsX-like permease family protein [Paenibacillus albidus]GGF93996.1 bacitracin export permease protein BceB [Paenibacillus albidus]
MTLYELVLRSMRKNLKHYYLYFFALILSTSLYFVFASLQNESTVMAATFVDIQFKSLFRAAGVLLIVIMAVFIIHANGIFLKRRSREIGLYQLVGLTRRTVGGLLIAENLLLGLGALLLGIGGGAFVSRLFLLTLMKLTGTDNVITLSFSSTAALQTATVFAVLIGFTWVQMLFMVYRTTLLDLFKGEQQGEPPKQPRPVLSAMLGLLGLVLIVAGYLLSSQITSQGLLLPLLGILAFVISGTYLFFRVMIGWVFYRIRRSMDGQLGLKNSLSLAPVIHRMKGNANSLTLITILSATTLTMVAVAYSLYYSAGSESRAMLPYDFALEQNEQATQAFQAELEKSGIAFAHQPVEAVRLAGTMGQINGDERSLLLLAAEQLQASGAELAMPAEGEGVLYNGQRKALSKETDNVAYPQTIAFAADGVHAEVRLTGVMDRYVMNYNINGRQLVVPEATVRAIREQMMASSGIEAFRIHTYQIADPDERAAASGDFAKYIKQEEFRTDFYAYSQESRQKFGLIMFVAGFLGLIFLIMTGSILYFKQMTEAEQEKQNYTILRQLGFSEREMMGGIIRKQLFVFGIPLAIGLLHSIFALKAAATLTFSGIVFPAAAAMGVYTFIYLIFAALTVGYYRRIVKALPASDTRKG